MDEKSMDSHTEDLKDKLEKVKKRGKEKRKEGEKKKESKDYLIWKYKIKKKNSFRITIISGIF